MLYSSTFECHKVFIPKWDEEKQKNVSIPIKVRKLILTHIPSGQRFTFGISKRKGNLTFKDSRDNKSLHFVSFLKELGRLIPNESENIIKVIKGSL